MDGGAIGFALCVEGRSPGLGSRAAPGDASIARAAVCDALLDEGRAHCGTLYAYRSVSRAVPYYGEASERERARGATLAALGGALLGALDALRFGDAVVAFCVDCAAAAAAPLDLETLGRGAALCAAIDALYDGKAAIATDGARLKRLAPGPETLGGLSRTLNSSV